MSLFSDLIQPTEPNIPLKHPKVCLHCRNTMPDYLRSCPYCGAVFSDQLTRSVERRTARNARTAERRHRQSHGEDTGARMAAVAAGAAGGARKTSKARVNGKTVGKGNKKPLVIIIVIFLLLSIFGEIVDSVGDFAGDFFEDSGIGELIEESPFGDDYYDENLVELSDYYTSVNYGEEGMITVMVRPDADLEFDEWRLYFDYDEDEAPFTLEWGDWTMTDDGEFYLSDCYIHPIESTDPDVDEKTVEATFYIGEAYGSPLANECSCLITVVYR